MRKEKQIKLEKDVRVTKNYMSIKSFLLLYFILTILTTGQSLIFRSFVHEESLPPEYALSMSAYWAITTLIFCLISARQRYLNYDRPLMALSATAKKVAEGNYSVRISPLRKDKEKDYVEILFEDFNKMVEELGSTEMMKSDFVANVSHEIKTPLSVIQTYATVLQKDNLTTEVRKEYTDTIIVASKKLTSLVTNILKLNKLESQEIHATAQAFNLSRQLIECAILFEDLREEKNITFVVDIEDSAIISADESMLEIVWNNLLLNAFKYTEAGGIVKLKQSSNGDSIKVTVEDSGCGISEGAIKHIFDKFYQGDTSHSQEGNGLGLSLSKKVIDLIGGSIVVESKEDVGTTFTVLLKAK